MTGESPEEYKNSIVIPIYTKCGKPRVKNYSIMDVFYKI
jgi:hypothetical protein